MAIPNGAWRVAVALLLVLLLRVPARAVVQPKLANVVPEMAAFVQPLDANQMDRMSGPARHILFFKAGAPDDNDEQLYNAIVASRVGRCRCFAVD